jgi:hypothetical protein
MALIGEHIPDYVQKQINIRQKTHGSGVFDPRTDDQLLVLNSKTAFIKLASGVWMGEEKLREIGGDEFAKKYIGTGLAREHVLFGGYARMGINSSDEEGILLQRTGFLGDNGAYQASPEWGIVPMPGIDSIDVKSMNRGSLKKATVKLTAQNRDQLAILDVLYLRLGYTVLLEWGNTLYIDNEGNIQKSYTSLIENNKGFFSDQFNINEKTGLGKTSFKPILDKIANARKAHAGNFDALLGKVSNFNWSFNPDGSYDIEITLISLGDVIESLKTNVPAVSSTLEYVNKRSLDWLTENDSLSQHRKDNIILSLLHIFRLINLTPKGKDITIVTKDNPTAKPGKLLDGGGSKIKITDYTLTLTAKYYFYNNSTKDNVLTTQLGKFSDGGIYDHFYPAGTEIPIDGTVKLNPKQLPNGTWVPGLTDSQNRVLPFATSTPNKTFSESKTFTETEIGEWKKDKTDVDNPIYKWIEDWKSKYVFTESEFNTKKNGWAPEDLVGPQFKKLADIYNIKSKKPAAGGEYRTYTFVPNVNSQPAESSTTGEAIDNPLDDTGYEDQDAFLLNMTPKQYYIRFGYLLKLLKNKVITRVDVGNATRSNNPNIFDIDTSNAPMLCLPLQISFDWRTCIVARNDFNRPGAFNQDIFPELKSWVTKGNTANAMNIYLNFNFIADAMSSNIDAKGNVSVYDFIKAMCDGINKALAGVNNLEPIIDEEDNILRIFDSTSRPRETNKPDPDYLLQLYGYGDGSVSDKDSSTFVRKIDLKTAITPEYATMITVGAAAGGYVKGTEATAFARWNEGIKDRFKTKLISADPQIDKTSKPNDNDDDTRITFFQTFRWSAKSFGIEPSDGDQSAYIWGMFP